MAALWPLEHVAPLRAMARRALLPRDARLEVRAMGLTFPTPVGLAGGFDKNARRLRALASLGFGHLEAGTVTAEAQHENPRPNLFRLPADHALVNRLGFPNDGARAIAARVPHGIGVPLAMSIGKSRSVPLDPIDGVVADYLLSYSAVRDVADFVVVNVSSPNTKDLRALQGAALAKELLAALCRARREGPRPTLPLLLKVAPDLGNEDLDALFDVAGELGLDGVVATNTTIARDDLATPADEIERIGAGGLSGPPLRARALDVVRRARARLGASPTVIGVGGIERAEHAVAMLEAGANLVQLYTGFVYGGPLTASRIARGVLREIERRGLTSVAEISASARRASK